MGLPKRGNWTLFEKMELPSLVYECWERWSQSKGSSQTEHHVHLPTGETIVFSHEGLEGAVKILQKQQSRPCNICGRLIEFPDDDILEPLYKYGPKVYAAALKHAWEYHRGDFPSEFTSLSQLKRWLTTPEGKEWSKKSSGLANTDEIMAEAERIIRGQ